jgi:hypothetical protein
MRKKLNIDLEYVAKSESESYLTYLTLTLAVLVASKKVTKTFLNSDFLTPLGPQIWKQMSLGTYL